MLEQEQLITSAALESYQQGRYRTSWCRVQNIYGHVPIIMKQLPSTINPARFYPLSWNYFFIMEYLYQFKVIQEHRQKASALFRFVFFLNDDSTILHTTHSDYSSRLGNYWVSSESCISWVTLGSLKPVTATRSYHYSYFNVLQDIFSRKKEMLQSFSPSF